MVDRVVVSRRTRTLTVVAAFVVTVALAPPLAGECTCSASMFPSAPKLGDTVTFTGTYSADCLPPVSAWWDARDLDPSCPASSASCTGTIRCSTGGASSATFNVRDAMYVWCNKTISYTVPGEVQVGSLKLSQIGYNGVCKDGDKHTFRYGVFIGDMLHFSGGEQCFLQNNLLTFGGSQTNTLIVQRPSVGNLPLLGAANLSIAIDGSARTLSFSAVSIGTSLQDTLNGVPMFPYGEPLQVLGDRVRIRPTVYLGQPPPNPAVATLRATVDYFSTRRKELAGLELLSGRLNPSIEVSSPTATFVENGTFAGTAKVSFPNLGSWKLDATWQAEAGCINTLQATPPGARHAPLGNSSFRLANALLDVDDMCSPSGPRVWRRTPQCLFAAETSDAFFTVCPRLVVLEPPSTLLLGGAVAPTSLMGAVPFELVGRLDIEKNYLWAIADVVIGDEQGRTIFYGHWQLVFLGAEEEFPGLAAGSLTVYPVTCGTPACLLANAVIENLGDDGRLHIPYLRMLSGATGDRLRGRGRFAGELTVGGIQLLAGILVWTDSNEVVRAAGAIAGNLVAAPAASTTSMNAASTSVERAYSIPQGRDTAVLGATGSRTLPSIYLRTPSGQKVTPSTTALLPGARYLKSTADRAAFFWVSNPAAGVWVVGEDNLPASEVTFTGLANQPAPVTTFASVIQNGSSVAIQAAVAPAAQGTTVSLFYSSGQPGVPEGVIAARVPATTGTVKASWDTSTVPSGAYTLFAVTDDGVSVPVTTTWPTPVPVANGGLAAPTGLSGTSSADTVTLTWTPSTSAAATGTRVSYTDAPGRPGYPRSHLAAAPGRATISGLDPTRAYRFVVQALDAAGHRSPESAPFLSTPCSGGCTYIVPSVAHAPGSGSTQWRSDVAVANHRLGPANLTLTYYPETGAAPAPVTLTLAAGATREWRDILVTRFGVGSAATSKGTLVIATDQPLAMASRTYNQQSANETFGQYYPGLTAADALPEGETGVLPGLKKSAGFRTNVGAVNLGAAACTATVKLYGESGARVGSDTSLSMPAGRWTQANDIFASSGAGNQGIAYATVEPQTAGCRLWAYASVIDATTGDPTTIPLLRSTGRSAQLVPSVAHQPGSGGTQWRSDVAAVNRGAEPASVTLSFIPDTGSVLGTTTTLPAGGTVEWQDILVSALGLPSSGSSKGTLWVSSSQPLLLVARTYNRKSATATFGQYYPALTQDDAFAGGDTVLLPQLRRNSFFRTNVGAVSFGSTPAAVVVTLFNAAGTQVGTSQTLTVPAGGWLQQNDIFAAAGAGFQDVAYATVRTDTPGSSIWPYASVIDTATGDPTTIPALR